MQIMRSFTGVLALFCLLPLAHAADRGWTPLTEAEARRCVASLERDSYFVPFSAPKLDGLGRRVVKLQTEIFNNAYKQLIEALIKSEGTNSEFMRYYTSVRTAAFRVQVLAKLFKKSGTSANEMRLEQLRLMSKELEDRLGRFNELDELVKIVKRRAAAQSEKGPKTGGFSVKEEWELKRASALGDLRQWMRLKGWASQASEGGLVETGRILASIEIMSDQDTMRYLQAKVPKMLRKLQEELAEGEYSPADPRAGYSVHEIEEKVHELRRELRELAMAMQFTGGVFSFTIPPGTLPSASTVALIEKYKFVLGKAVAKTPFAKLPPVTVPDPLFVSRELFVLLVELTNEIGGAKDWAQDNQRLFEAGLEAAAPKYTQRVTQIKGLDGRPTSLNALMRNLIRLLNEERPLEALASLIEVSRF